MHGDVVVSSLAMQIIDTPEFRRLSELRQLALVHYVFPGAKHTRFEHSIGVYYLTGKYLDYLARHTFISDRQKELIKIAGLVDIGHAMFSHLFDRKFSHELGVPHHEERGIEIFRNMVKKYKIPSCRRKLILSVRLWGARPPLAPRWAKGKEEEKGRWKKGRGR